MGFFQKLMGGGKGGGKLNELLETLTTDLKLDANQIEKMKAAFQVFKEKRKEIKSGDGDREQIKQARTQMTGQMMALLNDQQKQTFIANAAKYDGILHQE